MKMKYLMAFVFLCLQLINVYAGDCDHLEPYPVYIDTQYQNFNLTTWNKPWRPEIDWLDSYVNLSSYHPIVLEALAVGYRTTKYSKYFSSTEWGCILMFPMDSELGDEYYMKYYADTNDTMYMCTPYIPVRPDMRRKYAQTHPHIYSMVGCIIYQLGYLEKLYKVRNIFSTHGSVQDQIFLPIAAAVIVCGGFGNLLILRVISTQKELQTPTNYFLGSLAVVDLLNCLTMPIGTILNIIGARLTFYGCFIRIFLSQSLLASSFYHLTTISFERYFAICYPMTVNSICTTRRAKVVIPILWIISVCICLPFGFIQEETEEFTGHYKCHYSNSFMTSSWAPVAVAIYFVLLILLPFCLLVHNYVRISVALFQSLKENVHLQERVSIRNYKLKEETEKRIKVVKMLIVVVVIFTVCATPLGVFDFWTAMTSMITKTVNSHKYMVYNVVLFLAYVNSCVNVFIYYLTSDQFRRAFRDQLRCCRRKDSGSGDVLNRSLSMVRNRKRNHQTSSLSVISSNINLSNTE